MINVAFIFLDNMLSTSITWPTEMLNAALQLNRSHKLNIQTISVAKNKAVKTPSGLKLLADINLDTHTQNYDYIFIPALWRNPRKVISQSAELITWLKEQHSAGASITAVGTGCCLLAETGLLDKKPATTHWYFFDEFEKMYPEVELKREHFITEAERLFCAASINSLADLTIHHISNIFNLSTAQHIEKHFSHEIRQSYDKRAYFEFKDNRHADETIAEAQSWLQEHYAEPLKLETLATKFGLSDRHFARRFKEATGKTPTVYLQILRFQHAKDLLQSTNLSIQEVAFQTGFSNTSYFSALFKKQLGTTPKEYRKTVRAKLFSY